MLRHECRIFDDTTPFTTRCEAIRQLVCHNYSNPVSVVDVPIPIPSGLLQTNEFTSHPIYSALRCLLFTGQDRMVLTSFAKAINVCFDLKIDVWDPAISQVVDFPQLLRECSNASTVQQLAECLQMTTKDVNQTFQRIRKAGWFKQVSLFCSVVFV